MGVSDDGQSSAYYRRRLYDVLSAADLSNEEKRTRLLAVGCERLGLANAHVTRIDRETGRHEIVESWGSDVATAGTVSALDRTFCRETVERDGRFALADVPESAWADDPAADRFGLGSYVGTTVIVGTEVYGTVCLVDEDPKGESFGEADRSFVALLAQAVGRLIERANHESVLREERELSDLFVREVEDYAIFRLDAAGFVDSWNAGAAKLKGYEAADVVGEHVSTFYPTAAREAGKPGRLLERARRDGRVEDEGWRVREDGSRFWALVTITALRDEDGDLQGFGKVTRDLTERRSLREQLATEKQFTERTIDTLEDVYFVVDRDGAIERTNERLETVTDSTERALVGTMPAALFVPEDEERVERGVETAFDEGDASVEATLLAADGQRRRYEVRCRSFTTGEADPKVVGIGRDITERTRYEERLEVAQRVLRHNLRNDLNVIQGWAETIRSQCDDGPAEAAAAIERTAADIVNLSEKTRTMAELDPSPGADDRARFDATLRSVVGEVADEHPAATIDVNQPAADDLLVASGDLLRTAVRNAVENAVEHNPDGDPAVRVDADHRDGDAVVAVSDDCPPIPREEQRVLEHGESPLSHGSGMGLWLIQWAASALGGTVTFECADGGNTVRIRVPVRRAD